MKRLWYNDIPIINSIMEVDVYKFLMLYFIYRYFPDLLVGFAFTNRTIKVKLAERIDIDQLREECKHVQTLRFADYQIGYLKSWGLFPDDFLKWLRQIRLPDPKICKLGNGQFSIEVHGLWSQVTLWELFILPIMSELNTRWCVEQSGASHETIIQEGERRLFEKIEIFKKMRWLTALFGLRRRASGLWERHVTEILLQECRDKISGASNVEIAYCAGIEAIGTNAHELPMALYALRRWESPRTAWEAQYEVLEKWQKIYGHKSLIMLPDTFGSEQFFSELPWNFLRDWRGARQDSGDPFVFGERLINKYESNRIDPMEKLVLFTDGLNLPKMQALEDRFYGRINGGFGWGTNCSNDFGDYIQPLSMVMKLVEAAGRPAIKLSDNLNKAIGVPEEVAAAKDIFGYTNTFKEECVY